MMRQENPELPLQDTLSDESVNQLITRAHLFRELGKTQLAAKYFDSVGKYFYIKGQKDKSWDFFEEKQRLLECIR